jgi:site-specific recombinase XerD
MKKRPTDNFNSPHSTGNSSPKIPRRTWGNLALIAPTTGQSHEETDPFRGLIRDWIDWGRSDGLSEKTLEDYSSKLYKFWWWWHDHTHYSERMGPHPEAVTTREAREFATYLRENLTIRWGEPVGKNKQKLSAATIASYGRTVKVFFAWCEREGFIEQTPFNKSVKFTSRHKQDRTIKRVELEDQEKLFNTLSEPDRLALYVGVRDLAMISLLLDSGIRRGELLGLHLGDLELPRRRCKVNGKSGPRYAFFGDKCRRALADYLQRFRTAQDNSPDSPLWLAEDAVPLTEGGFGMMIRRLSKKSGVSFHPHRLRHTFASKLADDGVNVFNLKEMLGHKSITTTMIYVQGNPETLAKAHRPNSPLDNLKYTAGKRTRGRPPGRKEDKEIVD